MLRSAVNAVFPPICPVTGAEVGASGGLSPEAWGDLVFLAGAQCRQCGRELAGIPSDEVGYRCDPCLTRAHLWTRGSAAFRYEGTGRALILALKHGDRLDLVPMLARWMRVAGADLIAEADLILPVPLHWGRMMKRRYNQSAELARAICRQERRARAYAPNILYRKRRTATQDGKSREARIANMAGAFTVTRGAEVTGKRLLLIDDVHTTGATLDALASVLLDAGAAQVDVLVSALVNYEPGFYMRRDAVIEELPDDED